MHESIVLTVTSKGGLCVARKKIVSSHHALYPFNPRAISAASPHYVYCRPVLLMAKIHVVVLLASGPCPDRYRVVAVDHIGCGLSDKPSPAEYSYRLAQRIADLGQFIEKLDLHQITLVAHDWGGGIGMGAAVAAPERFARFVLMNTAAFRAPRCPWQIRLCHVPLLGQVAIQGLNLFARAALRMTVCQHQRMTPAVKAGYLAPYDSWRHRAAIYRFVLDIPLSPSHPSYETLAEVERGLAKFRQHPACLIWGMRDWCFSSGF